MSQQESDSQEEDIRKEQKC